MHNTTPFTIAIPQTKLDWIAERIRSYQWFEEPEDADPADWQYGMDQTYLKALCDHWLKHYLPYGWREIEEELNDLPHFMARVDGVDIHFLHIKGSNPDNRPLILLHGWPGSFVEYLAVMEPLARPDNYGGKAEDGRDVIVPSLVGYGFSGPPPKPIGPRAQARYMNGLMTDALGFDDYVVQGGDWGALITAWLGFDFGSNKGGPVHAIHMNMTGVRPAVPTETEEEKAWEAEVFNRYSQSENAYFQVQATKPQSLAYGMMDSPVGQAAWIVEKFHRWSDLSGKGKPGGDINDLYPMDKLLTNVMLYVATGRFNTAAWQYRGAVDEGGFALPAGERVEIPCGFAVYPREIVPTAPRSYCEKGYNVVHYEVQKKGGHFAAYEQPSTFVDDVRSFLKGWG